LLEAIITGSKVCFQES